MAKILFTAADKTTKELPVEVAEDIIESLETSRDLAALSAVSHGFRTILDPKYELSRLRLRQIAVGLDDPDTISKLAAGPRIACHVRKLWMSDCRPNLPMHGYWRMGDEPSTIPAGYTGVAVNPALSHLGTLRSLAIDAYMDPPFQSFLLDGLDQMCPLLTDLTLSMRLPFGLWASVSESQQQAEPNPVPAADANETSETTVSKAVGYRRFTCHLDSMEASPTLLQILATKCSRVESLCLSLLRLNLDSFDYIHFPCLKHLWLEKYKFQFGPQYFRDFSDFLARHPLIEHLHCRSGGSDASLPYLDRDILPNLRRLNAPLDASSMLRIVGPMRDGRRRPLEWIDFEDNTHVVAEICEGLAEIPSVSTVQIGYVFGTGLLPHLGAIPNLKTLAYTPWIGPDKPGGVSMSAEEFETEMAEHLEALGTHLPSIQCLKYFFAQPNAPPPPQQRNTVEKLGALCPDLHTVDQWHRTSTGWEHQVDRSASLLWPSIDPDIPKDLFADLRPWVGEGK